MNGHRWLDGSDRAPGPELPYLRPRGPRIVAVLDFVAVWYAVHAIAGGTIRQILNTLF